MCQVPWGIVCFLTCKYIVVQIKMQTKYTQVELNENDLPDLQGTKTNKRNRKINTKAAA